MQLKEYRLGVFETAAITSTPHHPSSVMLWFSAIMLGSSYTKVRHSFKGKNKQTNHRRTFSPLKQERFG